MEKTNKYKYTPMTSQGNSVTSHYRPPVIHVISSRPSESYVKFNGNHVTWDKPETRTRETKTRLPVRNLTDAADFAPNQSNGPTGNSLRENVGTKQMVSKWRDKSRNANGYHSKNSATQLKELPPAYTDTEATNFQEEAEATPGHIIWKQETQEIDSNFRDHQEPPGEKKLRMKIVDGEMFIAQISTEETPGGASRHETYMFVSILVCACFNCPMGIISLILSVKSQRLYDLGMRKRAKFLANVSLAVSLVGMVIGVFLILGFVYLLAGLTNKL